MPDPKAKPAPVLSELELRELRLLSTYETPLYTDARMMLKRLLDEHAAMKREIELLREELSVHVGNPHCSVGIGDELYAFDAAKPGAGEG